MPRKEQGQQKPGFGGPRIREIPLRLVIPNLITVLAICAGLTGIRLAFEGRFELAVAMVLFAAALDALDGRIEHQHGSVQDGICGERDGDVGDEQAQAGASVRGGRGRLGWMNRRRGAMRPGRWDRLSRAGAPRPSRCRDRCPGPGRRR